MLPLRFFTNRLSEATEYYLLPQAEAWGFVTITALRAEDEERKLKHLDSGGYGGGGGSGKDFGGAVDGFCTALDGFEAKAFPFA